MAHRQNASPEICELPLVFFFHIFHMSDKCLAPASISRNLDIPSASHVDPFRSNVDPSPPNKNPNPPSQHRAGPIQLNPVIPRDNDAQFLPPHHLYH